MATPTIPPTLASPLILQRPDGRWAILFDAAQPAAMPPPAKKVKPEGTTFTVVGYRQTVEPGAASLTASGCYRHPVGPVAEASLP